MAATRLIRASVLAFCVFLLAPSAAVPDQRSAAKRFEDARRDEPSLIAFLKAMPKGADLHHHFGAGIFAEDALQLAIRRGLFYNPRTGFFDAAKNADNVPAAQLQTDDQLRYRFLNSASMRGTFEGAAGGHDHFFRTFGIFGSATAGSDPADRLIEAMKRARLQNMQYLELMAGPAGGALERVRQASAAGDNAEQAVRRLQPRIDEYVAAAKTEMDRWDAAVAREPDAAGVKARYLITAFRTDTDARIQATWAGAFALMKADPRVVGVNFAAPEDHPVSREGFGRHMAILDGLWKHFDKPNVTLHAGELNLWISPVEDMTSHIRRSIEMGHARRIGHGISIAWENDLAGLLRKMKDEGIAVEVCPTSNAVILGADGDRHPFRLYRKAGVPLTINTDDEGVNRSNLTMEYLRAVKSWGLTYPDVKELSRNGIEYSFLSGASLFEGRDYRRLRPEWRALRARRWQPTPDEERRLSDKAAVQVRLERAYLEFEE
jgi:adenosine deaminase